MAGNSVSKAIENNGDSSHEHCAVNDLKIYFNFIFKKMCGLKSIKKMP